MPNFIIITHFPFSLTKNEREDLSSNEFPVLIGRSLFVEGAETGGMQDVDKEWVQHVTVAKAGGVDHPRWTREGIVEPSVAELIRCTGRKLNALEIKTYSDL